MRVVSVVYHFCRNIMFRLRNSGLFSFWGRCVRIIVPILLFLTPVFVLRILWRKKDGNEPEEDSLDAAERVVGAAVNRPPEAANVENERGNQHETSSEKIRPVRSSLEDAEGDAREGRYEEEDFNSEEYRVETTDELYCEYDSTWEIDPNEERPPRRNRRPRNSKHYKFTRFERAARDMQNYRQNYPNQINTQQWRQQSKQQDDKPNLNFYLGRTASVPDGVYITDFHTHWRGNYDRLEDVHTFIQWLFPLQEPGMNYEASTLTKEEIKDFRKNSIAKQNLLESYKLMLDFYGIELLNEKTGEVRKAQNWKDRFNNLNSHTHNSLRITRILKCLGNLGYHHYQAPLVHFFLEETLVNDQLPSIRESILSYFMFAVLDKRARRNLIKYAYMNYEPKDEFVWCPKKIQMLWSGLSKHRKKETCDSSESQEKTLAPNSVPPSEDWCKSAEYESDMNEDIQSSSGSYNWE